MDIRSVTLFVEATDPASRYADFLSAARERFHVTVQTTRLATTPFPTWTTRSHAVADALALQAAWQAVGIDYISVGSVLLSHDLSWLDVVPELVAASDVLFASAEIATLQGGIDFARIRKVAETVQALSHLHGNGFGNLYFTALANCMPRCPFFPVAYNDHGNGFALAVESADVARRAIQASSSLADARANLIEAIEMETARLTAAAEALSAEFNIPFHGIDFSLAPFPSDDKSLGGALEDLGIGQLGDAGSLFAAAFLTETLQRASFPRVGFNGLMLPVLEDSILAQRAASDQLTIQSLLSYSAVCGVGLDTIPIAGDISAENLSAIFLDVAAMALRLNKPLTARIMPMPSLQAGDPISFDFPYFADGRVMPTSASATGRIQNNPPLTLHQIHHQHTQD